MRTLTFNRVIGEGAMGTVYHAELRVPQGFARQCAVKVMRDTGGAEVRFQERMRDEARLLGMLDDEQILGVLELAQVEGRDCVLMEYVEGVDLHDVLVSAPIPPRPLAEACADVAGALHRAHNALHPSTGEPLNVILDIKPANIMVTTRGSVKLLDFGVARARFGSRESDTRGLVLGTLNYFPPEVIQGSEPTTAVDTYGLGLAIWECATGKQWGKPQAHRDRHERRVKAAVGMLSVDHQVFRDLLTGLLAWDPADRPDAQSAERALLAIAADAAGTSLRAWARKEVPALLEDGRPSEVPEDSWVGRTLTLGGSPVPLQPMLTEPPLRGESDSSVLTYNDLAPPAAVERVRYRPGDAKPAKSAAVKADGSSPAPPPSVQGPPPWIWLVGAAVLGVVAGLVLMLVLLALVGLIVSFA